MELQEAIKNRRSVRKFNEENVSKEDIMKILESARLAPSAKNMQPWHFVVLKNEQIEHVYQMMVDKMEKDESTRVAEPTSRTVRRANTLILVFNTMPEESLINMEQSIGAAIENMLLQATELGIGSVWIRMTYIIEDELRECYHMDGMRLSATVALGHYDELPGPRPRKEIEDIMTWYE